MVGRFAFVFRFAVTLWCRLLVWMQSVLLLLVAVRLRLAFQGRNEGWEGIEIYLRFRVWVKWKGRMAGRLRSLFHFCCIRALVPGLCVVCRVRTVVGCSGFEFWVVEEGLNATRGSGLGLQG